MEPGLVYPEKNYQKRTDTCQMKAKTTCVQVKLKVRLLESQNCQIRTG
jgi:hypothetical protein